MRRLLPTIILVSVLLSNASAQSWSAYDQRLYRHEARYGISPSTLVEIAPSKIHPRSINRLDFNSKIFLGLTQESALQSVGRFREMLLLSPGARNTLKNDGYTLFTIIKESEESGRLLVTRRINDGGTVTFSIDMLDMLEDALVCYDEEEDLSFPYKQPVSREEAEIARYKEMLAHSSSEEDMSQAPATRASSSKFSGSA